MNYIFAYTGDVLPLLQRDELVARREPMFHSYLYCTAAYLVHRRGMKALLDRFWPGGALGSPFEQLISDDAFDFSPFGADAVSDYILYSSGAGGAFLSLRPLFG